MIQNFAEAKIKGPGMHDAAGPVAFQARAREHLQTKSCRQSRVNPKLG